MGFINDPRTFLRILGRIISAFYSRPGKVTGAAFPGNRNKCPKTIKTICEMKESAYTSEFGEIRYKDKKYIRRQSRSLSEERLSFRDGERLGDVSIGIESGKTLR